MLRPGRLQHARPAVWPGSAGIQWDRSRNSGNWGNWYWSQYPRTDSFGFPRSVIIAIRHSHPGQWLSCDGNRTIACCQHIAHLAVLAFARHSRFLGANINRLFPIEHHQPHGHFRLQHAVCNSDNFDCG